MAHCFAANWFARVRRFFQVNDYSWAGCGAKPPGIFPSLARNPGRVALLALNLKHFRSETSCSCFFLCGGGCPTVTGLLIGIAAILEQISLPRTRAPSLLTASALPWRRVSGSRTTLICLMFSFHSGLLLDAYSIYSQGAQTSVRARGLRLPSSRCSTTFFVRAMPGTLAHETCS